MKTLTILLASVLLCLSCDDESFDVDAGTPMCDEGDQKCYGQGAWIVECIDGQWLIETSCITYDQCCYHDPVLGDPFCDTCPMCPED